MVQRIQKTQGSAVKMHKRKKWKKGHSCVSNPSEKKHRLAAKSSFFNVVAGPSSLTTDALAKHDARGVTTFQDAQSDAASSSGRTGSSGASGKTGTSWASNFTDCTNVTFNKVIRLWNSNSAAHKSVLAVLAAVTEVIKQEGGQETDTEYFGALMTALDGNPEDEETVAAITYLLSMTMKRVSQAVLRNKFTDVSKVLVDILAHHLEASSPSVLRNTLKCLSHILRAQELAQWSNSSTMNVYNIILNFTVNSKPKVRKAGQEAVVAILKGSEFMTSEQAPAHHPAGPVTAKYCVDHIEKDGGSKDATMTLHILGLLQDILSVLPRNSIKSACETVLKLMTLADVMLKSVSMKCLHKMFSCHPSASALTPDLNGQIITALYDFQPSENDIQLMTAWLTLMTQAHTNLYSIKEELFLGHVPNFVSAGMACLRSSNQQIAKVAAQSLTTLLKECVAPLVTKENTKATLSVAVGKLFKHIEAGLGYQYHASWGLILELLAVAYENLGKEFHKVMMKSLQSLADLRNSHSFPHKAELDKAVGMAIRSMGPQWVLSVVPLQIVGDGDNYDFPRSWLLPLVRDYTQDTELGYFASYFLPLAAKLRLKAVEHDQQHRQLESKTYNTLQLQIWSLLPGFCTRPTDLAQSFQSMAKILGAGLRDREDIRMDILAGLRKLILQNLEHEANRSELAKYAKNYLPLLFNLYTSNPEKPRDPIRLSVLETIKIYIKICDDSLTASYVDSCHQKAVEKDVEIFRKHALLDLIISLVPYTDANRLQIVFTQAVTELKSTDRTAQKKSYRILEEICSSSSDACRTFVANHLTELQDSLLTALSKSSPSSKAPRLRCLIQIIKKLEESEMDFIQALIPEAVLCTKETAEKARQAAYSLLVEMVHTLYRWNPDTPKTAVVQMYFEMVLAGLAGKPHVVNCTLLALTRITYEFKDYMNDDLLLVLMDSLCILLSSKAREVVTAALVFLKVVLKSFDDVTIGQFLEKIISCIVAMKEDNKHHVRFKSKEIFTRLVRKFGYETVLHLVPSSHHKQLNHIRKMQEREKKQRSQQEDSDDETEAASKKKNKPESFEEFLADSDSDLDLEEEDTKPRKAGRKARKAAADTPQGAAWLREDDGLLDFMDVSAAKKVLATNPHQASKPKKSQNDQDSVFKMAPDGRLIIRADSDDDGKDKEPVLELDELLDAFDGPGKKKKKRKMLDAEEEEEDARPMKYKAGGHGIHRPVRDQEDPGKDYRSKKGKGDVKKKDKHDPYAYIPLEFSSLNRRKKAKAAGQFKNLVRGAKKGAAKGRKLKGKKK